MAGQEQERGLTQLLDAGTVSRGLDYARRGRARVTSSTDEPGAVKGLVRGSGGIQYETSATYEVNSVGLITAFDGWCSCPVGEDCKHAVALLLTALTARNATRFPVLVPPIPAPTAPPTPIAPVTPLRSVPSRPSAPGSALPAAAKPRVAPWEAVIASIAGSDPGSPGETVTEPLGLAFELVLPVQPRDPERVRAWHAARVGQPEGRLAVRPVCLGAQGKWIRTGVSWGDLAHGYARWKFREDHVRVLTALARLNDADTRWSYSGTDAWIQLSTMSSPAIWDLLDEAAALNLALITLDAGQPSVVVGKTPAELTVDVSRTDGELRVQPSVRLDGLEAPTDRVLFLGDPAHGIATWTMDRNKPTGLTLSRLDRRADRALRDLWSGGGLSVPAADESRFVDEYVPMLRRRHRVRSVDPSVSLPEAQPPVLALTVEVLPRHELLLRWEWLYRHGSADRRFPLIPTGGDRMDGRRDQPQESRILGSVVPMLGEVPQLVGLSRLGVLPVTGSVLSGRDAILFAGSVLPRLRQAPAVEVVVSGELPNFRESADSPIITVSSTPADGSRDWFDLTVNIAIGSTEIAFEQVFLALAAGDDVMITEDGDYFSLDRPEFHKLRALIEEARDLQDRPEGPLKISRFQASLWDELEQLGVVDAQSNAWLSRLNSWRDDLAETDPPSGLLAQLRPYQLDGFRWLNLLQQNGLGGILADDMGLGKTVQTLAMIIRARAQEPDAPPFLVIAPTSVVGNWRAEAAKFAPGLRVAVVTETQTRRGLPLAEVATDADLVITSYTLFRLEFDAYERLGFSGLILDEAQVVKNHQSKAFAYVKRLSAPVKFAITGTPMENNLMELWALFSIVAPGLFPSPGKFTDRYRNPIERNNDAEALSRLRRRIEPLMLRRTKEQVATDLPAKQEQVLELELEPGHRRFYQRQLQRERQKILGLLGDIDNNRFEILRSLMILRQASIDPFLVDPENAKVGSTKLTMLMELLTDVIAEGHRTLIFSQFTGFLTRVRQRLDEEGVAYCYLDGSTRDRAKVLGEFREGTAPVFLISLKAGGVGLNLTEADYCIILDPWWNPAAEAQAVDRTHRIGQTKNVMVYRLVSKDTIEEKVMALKDSKSKLFAGVMAGSDDDGAAAAALGGGGAGRGGGKGISAADIRALLG